VGITSVPGRFDGLRVARTADEPFLFDVFCTGLADEVAAMPDPSLVRHFLRIQYTAQESRFRARYPGHERYVVSVDGRDAGRCYLHRTPTTLHAVDLMLLPEHRSGGVGSRLVADLLEEARDHRKVVSARVARRNPRATAFFATLGFRLAAMDDLDHYYEWHP
jgi:GNAT superfamily N-acetyltransferase